MIKVNNLSKEFHGQGTNNELLAVDHVDFIIQDGSFCALVGESGSGKSTLAQLMCGLLVPSSGEVLFEGKNISLCRGKQKQVLRSKIQLILQDGKGAMDPRFTVYQIIAEPIRNFRKLTKKEEEREINDLLAMMELPEEIKLRKAHELSGGQQKRVCIARALAAQPDVLIFDEAVSGLDVLVRKHILDLLKRLHQERKMTCFFITHDLDVALYLADRVMVMRSFDPATDMSNMAPGAMGDPILCQFSAFFENPEIFAELDSTSDSQRVQEIYGMILNGIADQNLLVPVTGTHDLALWNTDKITGYDFYTDASYVDIASVHVK